MRLAEKLQQADWACLAFKNTAGMVTGMQLQDATLPSPARLLVALTSN